MPLSSRIIITLTLTILSLAGCAIQTNSPPWQDSYRNCPESAQAYFRGIPLASRAGHEQSELFKPVDPSNCMIYVVRSDRPGSKSAHAKVFLYQPENEPPALPADFWPGWGLNTLLHPRWSERHLKETPQEFRKAEIFSPDVYVGWELAPGSYVLDASLHIFQPFAREVVSCDAGRTTFWAVTATSFLSSRAALNEISESEGKALVQQRLCSVGIQAGGPLSRDWIGERSCLTITTPTLRESP